MKKDKKKLPKNARLGSQSRSRILKVSVSNGQVSVLVSNDEDETTSLMGGYKSCNTNTIPIQSCLGSLTDSTSSGE